MVPGYDESGKLCTVQYINWNGQKRFEADSQKKSAFYEIAGDSEKIIIAEGYSTAASIHEATGYTVVVAFDAGNLIHVVKIFRKMYLDSEIIIAADNDQWKTETGNTGVESAKTAAIEINAKVAIPSFKNAETKPTDFNDLAALEGLEIVSVQIDAATPINKVEALKTEIQKIIGLGPLEQEVHRTQLAKKYGIRKSMIDKYIIQNSKPDSNYQEVVKQVYPASDPVDGTDLLDVVLSDLKTRVVLPDGAAEAITLWVMLTYCHQAFNILPLLGIISPEKRCGKTTLIEILQGLTHKGLSASNITTAAVFRAVEKYNPTLLIDEADTFLKGNDELRGIINSGHTRASAFVVRLEGDNHEPVRFSTWGPKVIGMIGTLPETIKDRSIVISLSRKIPSENIIKTGMDFTEKTTEIRAKFKRWADDHIEQLRTAQVSVPSSGNDRADDNWHPLFCIAHTIGGSWPEKVLESMQQLVNICGDDAIGTKLLTDVKGVFAEHAVDRIFSSDLIKELQALTDSPWADWNKGRGLTTNGLARLLKPFGVSSKTMRIDGTLAKGYTFESLLDAFNRYIPCAPSVTPLQTNNINKLNQNQSVTLEINATDENQDNQLSLLHCYSVTDELEGALVNKGVDIETARKWETGTI